MLSEKYIEDKLFCVKISNERWLYIGTVAENVFRVVYTGKNQVRNDSCMVEKKCMNVEKLKIDDREDICVVSAGKILVEIEKNSGRCCWYRADSMRRLLREGEKTLTEIEVMRYQPESREVSIQRVATVDGERNFVNNLVAVKDRMAYRGTLGFRFEPEEGIYGLGQGEEGIYNYHGHSQYLYQHNMRIPMPCFISDNGYGILADCCSLMTFESMGDDSHFFFDTIEQMDYYFVAGETVDEIVSGFRYLTGKARLLPKWAYGYLQSKEAYKNQQELIDVVAEYRKREVPIDGIIQDWWSWEDGNWGEKILDKKRYPDMKKAGEEINRMHAHTMVSIWPTMNSCGQNYRELEDAGCMLMDFTTYDAFKEEARSIYFNQVKKGLFENGFESWWCDSAEPFSGPDWNGEVKREPWERYLLVGAEHKKYLDPTMANAYALFHARGIYENQRKITDEKRVLNLIRSGYPSIQRYGTVLWSGDICATWESFAVQIREGLNMAMSGIPYWTLDIGGFFTVNKKWENRGCGCNLDSSMKWFWKGDYEDGGHDLGYRELYTRWIQYGAFLPIFRSHGTDTPREIWRFGEEGEMFYDSIKKFICLRYALMPYIYSLAARVYFDDDTMMRSLLFDFMEDPDAKDICDEFMFGPSLLVCPVMEPMYYEKESRPIQKEKVRKCYLPKGCDWYDLWTNQRYAGGQWIYADAPIDKMPIFVKSGAILPVSAGIQYADQPLSDEMEILVYSGADGEFVLYEDAGNGYGFEQGEYAVTKFRWSEKDQKLVIGLRSGEYPGMRKTASYHVRVIGKKENEPFAAKELL